MRRADIGGGAFAGHRLTLGLTLDQHLHKAGQAVDLFGLTRHNV